MGQERKGIGFLEAFLGAAIGAALGASLSGKTAMLGLLLGPLAGYVVFRLNFNPETEVGSNEWGGLVLGVMAGTPAGLLLAIALRSL